LPRERVEEGNTPKDGIRRGSFDSGKGGDWNGTRGNVHKATPATGKKLTMCARVKEAKGDGGHQSLGTKQHPSIQKKVTAKKKPTEKVEGPEVAATRREDKVTFYYSIEPRASRRKSRELVKTKAVKVEKKSRHSQGH